MADRIIVPTDASLNVQNALKQLQAQVDAVNSKLDALSPANADDLKKTLSAAQDYADKAVKSLDMSAYTQNDVVRGAGAQHSTGVVPDPGQYPMLVGDEPVLHADGTFKRVLDGVVRVLPSLRSNPGLGTEGKSLAQRVVNILGGLAVLGDLAAHSGRFRGLTVIGGPSSLNLRQYDPNHYPLFIKAAGGGAGVSPIQPNNVSGLQGWWKADAGCYKDAGVNLCANGDTVYQWADQSGNGRWWVNAGAGTLPVYNTNVKNGQPVLTFDASNDQLNNSGWTVPNLITTSDNTIFAVWAATSTNGTAAFYGYTGVALISLYQSNTALSAAITVGGVSKTATLSAVTSPNAYQIGTHYHAGSGDVYVGCNDTRTASMAHVAAGAIDSLTGANCSIGNSFGGFFGHKMAELIVYNVAVSEADRQGIEAYLANKYGITLGYSTATDSNVDYLHIEDASGNVIFKITNTGDVYVGATKLTVP